MNKEKISKENPSIKIPLNCPGRIVPELAVFRICICFTSDPDHHLKINWSEANPEQNADPYVVQMFETY